jgi:hypothetical protein
MRRTDGQPREIDSRFTHPFPHAAAAGHDLEPHRPDGHGGDLADGDTLSWETAWVDLGGEG